MSKNLYISEFFDQDYISKNKFTGKLFRYKNLRDDDDKSNSGTYYYNEAEKNKFLENYYEKKKNKNNLLNKDTNIKIKTETENKKLNRPKSLINFVAKEEKNKNLKINQIKDEMNLYVKMFKKKNIINNRNNFIKNRNLSASVKFNVNNLENMNTNMIKIVYQKIVQIPAPKVCYFSKEFKNEDDYLFYKPPLLSKTEICYFKKSYIYNDKKIFLPKKEICYFNRTFVTSEPKFKNTILSKRYFCTKIKKKYKGKKISAKVRKNIKNNKGLKNNNVKGIINKKTMKNGNNLGKNKRKSPKKEDAKFNSFQNHLEHNNINNKYIKKNKKINQINKLNKINNFKTVNVDENAFKKLVNNKNSILPKYINKINLQNQKPKTKNKSPKSRKKIRKNQNQNLPRLLNDQNNNNYYNNNNYNINNSSSSSSFERGRKHSSLFNHLLNKKEKKEKNENLNELLKPKKKKFILQKTIIPNGYELSRNNNKLYMPKIKDTNTNSISNSFKTPKTKISPNIKSSNDLIQKINDNIPINQKLSKKNKTINHNELFNSVENPSAYHIMNYNHKDIENNFIKCDIHYNTNNLLCPKCQQIRLSSMQESKTKKIQNINKLMLNENKNNKIMSKVKSDLVLTPLNIKNESNKNENEKIFEGFKKSNKSITLKKINFSKNNKGKEDVIKNYKSGLLAIKEYFNIK